MNGYNTSFHADMSIGSESIIVGEIDIFGDVAMFSSNETKLIATCSAYSCVNVSCSSYVVLLKATVSVG